MTGWSSEAAEQAGLRSPWRLQGEEGKKKLSERGHSGVPVLGLLQNKERKPGSFLSGGSFH